MKKENINFIKTDGKTALRRAFEDMDSKRFTVTAYARSLSVGHAIVSQVLNGDFNGSKNHRGGSTRKVICALKNDGVWIGPLPWEVK